MQSLDTQDLNANEKRKIISSKIQEEKNKLREEAHSLYDSIFNNINIAVQKSHKNAVEQAETQKLDLLQKNRFIISAVNNALNEHFPSLFSEAIIIKAEDFKKYEDILIIEIIQKYFAQDIEVLNQNLIREIDQKAITLVNEFSNERLDRNEVENELKNFTHTLFIKNQHEISSAMCHQKSLDLMFVEYTVTSYKINGLALNEKAIKTAAQEHQNNFQNTKNQPIQDIIDDFKTITSIIINTNNILNSKIIEAQKLKKTIEKLESTLIIAKSNNKKRKSSTKKKSSPLNPSFTPNFEEKKSKIILPDTEASFIQPRVTLSNASAKLLDNLQEHYEDEQGKLSDIIQDIKKSLTNVDDLEQAIDRISKQIMPSTTIFPKTQSANADQPLEPIITSFDEALTQIFSLIIKDSLKEDKQEKSYRQFGL
ncbi:MAG: hypothetical protein AB7D28_08360 [Candidatus Berkiella sp.]